MADTLRQALAAAAREFREAGIETPELDARLLVCHAAGLSHEDFMARSEAMLPPETGERLAASVERRMKGKPVSRIMGMREFYGHEFLIDRHTLDPRPDTETLIEATLDIVVRNNWQGEPLNLLDLGTGTGCILLTLLAELPEASGIGTDISGEALAIAAANARRLGLEDRAAFLAADWLDGIDGSFDLILANPPYVASDEIATLSPEVARYDPRLALDGGPDGLDAYRRIAARAGEALRAGGALVVEIGPGQAEAVQAILRAGGLEPCVDAVRRDLAGRPRAVVAGRNKAPEQKVAGQKRAWKG